MFDELLNRTDASIPEYDVAKTVDPNDSFVLYYIMATILVHLDSTKYVLNHPIISLHIQV